jgi:hypothetical protein
VYDKTLTAALVLAASSTSHSLCVLLCSTACLEVCNALCATLNQQTGLLVASSHRWSYTSLHHDEILVGF